MSRSGTSPTAPPEGQGQSEAQADAPEPNGPEPAKARRTGRPKPAPEAPPFRPKVTSIHATARRVVSTGPHESFDLMIYIEGEPDPNHTVRENIGLLSGLVCQEATSIAERVANEIQVSRG